MAGPLARPLLHLASPLFEAQFGGLSRRAGHGPHYLVGDGPRAPWRVAPGPFLDGSQSCTRYAARIVEKEGALFLLGFLHDAPDGSFVGAVSDPDPVSVDSDGSLHVNPRA